MAGHINRVPDSGRFTDRVRDLGDRNRSAVRRPGTRGQVAGAASSAALTLTWLGLSWWHPALTYHFGPPLAAAAWPLGLRARQRQRATGADALAAAAGGLIVAMTALAVAVAEHWLRGPTLIGRGSVPAEEMVLAVTAGAWGSRVAARHKRAWFLPAEPGQ